MKKQNKSKKRIILFGAVIPLALTTIGTAITFPLVLRKKSKVVEDSIVFDKTNIELTTNGSVKTDTITISKKSSTTKEVKIDVEQTGDIIDYIKLDENRIAIIAKNKGTATVTATLGSAKAICNVSVSEVSMELDNSAVISMEEGEHTVEVEAKMDLSNGQEIEWSVPTESQEIVKIVSTKTTSTGSIATVEGLKEGIGSVVATAGDITKTCAINVCDNQTVVIDDSGNVYTNIQGLCSFSSSQNITGDLGGTTGALNVTRANFNYQVILGKNSTIEGGFLCDCTSFNKKFILPNSLKTIPAAFLRKCTSFNQEIIFPKNLEEIGSQFILNNTVFNNGSDGTIEKPMVFPETLTTIDSNFLACDNKPSSKAFNQKIIFPKSLKKINGSFLKNNLSFNQKLEIPDGVTTLGINFLSNCAAFNNGCASGEVTNKFVLPSTVTTINESFMGGCKAFNQQIILPSECKQIDGSFMNSNQNFNQEIIIPAKVSSIGSGFFSANWYYANTINFAAISDPSNITITPKFLESVGSSNNITFKVASGTAATWQTTLETATAYSPLPTNWKIVEE